MIQETKGGTILLDFAIQTDRKIKSYRPDLIIKDYKRKICLLIDMSVSTDDNISVKEKNKI